MSAVTSDKDWLLPVLRQTLRSLHSAVPLEEVIISTERGIPNDPDTVQYIRELIYHILHGRIIVSLYNLVVAFALVLLTLLHLYSKIKERRRRNVIEVPHALPEVETPPASLEDTSDPESSSSSTLEGSLSSHSTLKQHDADVEHQPLLGTRGRRGKSASRIMAFPRCLQSWLLYQPRPIPLVNRNLPSNGTSLFVLAFLGVNVFFHLYQLPFEWKFFFVFADRAGLVFIVNLPLLYLLAAKNQPLKFLTGYSYEALNIYHRRVGELMCFEALIHFAGILVWEFALTPKWLMVSDSIWGFLSYPLILLGIGAFVSYELLYFTSLGSFRARFYELFLASHIILQIAALTFLWLHFPTSRPYVYAVLAIFTLDRVIWRLGMKTVTVNADLRILEDSETVLISSNWDIPRNQRRKYIRALRQSVLYGWQPADHVFVSVLSLGGTHALQAHPFTIASAAPDLSPSTSPHHAWLNLLVRVHSGFTSQLLQHARLNKTVRVRFDGPYGSSDPLDMLRASEKAVLIAGGSGIAVIFPLAWYLAQARRARREVYLLWVIHSRTQRSWISEETLAELREGDVHVSIPDPTAEAGRPDIPAYLESLATPFTQRLGVVVSGPDGLNRSVRNACAEAIRDGADINLSVEKFGWG